MVWTTTDFLSAVRRRTRIPDGDHPFSNTDLLELGDEETLTLVMPLVRRVKQEYGIAIYDVAIASGTYTYRLPTRTAGGTIKTLVHVDGDGNETHKIEPVSLTSLPGFIRNDAAVPTHYAMQADAVHLNGTGGTTLRMKYYRRPSKLVAVSAAGPITDNDPGTTGRVTLADTSMFSGTFTGDVVRAQPQFDLPLQDIVVSVVNGTTLSLATTGLVAIDVPDAGVGNGDYVTESGETPIPQVPDLCHPLLVAAVSVRVLESLGNQALLGAAQAKLEESKKAVEQLIEERDEGSSAKWIADSPLRQGFRSWRGRRW